MKRLLLRVGIRVTILYIIILSIYYLADFPIEYSAFIIGACFGFFNSSGITNFYDSAASIQYGSDVTPVRNKASTINPMFVASVIVFLSSFLVYFVSQ